MRSALLKPPLRTPPLVGRPETLQRSWENYLSELTLRNEALVIGRILIPLTDFGAKGDEITDDTAAVVAALASGERLTGQGKTYAVTGAITLPANAHLEDAVFKQLAPAASNAMRTLVSSSGNNIELRRVAVDRNGDGTHGALNDAAGIYITGGAGHHFEDIEVYGDDLGTGFVLSGCTDFRLIRPYVHDLNYELIADPGDDRVQGLWLNACSRFVVAEPRVEDLGGDFGSGATTEYSRGITVSGCSDFQMIGHRVKNVEQGVDLTGTAGNQRFELIGGHVQNCFTYGHKFANSARHGSVMACFSGDCGFAGFVISGPSEAALSVKTSDIDFIGCTAKDTGSNGEWSGQSPTGFYIQTSGFNPETTVGIRFIDCRAIDTQGSPSMVHGFKNQITAPTDGRYNEAIECVVIGATGERFETMHAAHARVKRSAAQTIGTASWTAVNWDSETEDHGSMHDTVTNNEKVYVRQPGIYRLELTAAFASNATGYRGGRLKRNGSILAGATVQLPAVNGAETLLQVSLEVYCDAADELTAEVFQNSGGDLDLTTDSVLLATKTVSVGLKN